MTTMKPLSPGIVRTLALTLAAALALRGSVGLTPLWWLAWVAPIPLLLLAFSETWLVAWLAVFVAALFGNGANLRYFGLVMPWPAAVLLIVLMSLEWVLVVTLTRRIALRHRSGWTVLAYPALWVALDTLLATFTPDGNWGSLAYSQSDILPFVQLAALGGVPALLFVLALVPSTIAFAIWRHDDWRLGLRALAATALVVAAVFAYGALRLATPIEAPPTRVGMASIDDPVWPKSPAADADKIREGYAALIGKLATQGAGVIVVPEKIAIVSPADAARWKQQFAALAVQNKVWLDVGIGIVDGGQPRNFAWLFDPAGSVTEQYEKHFLAPPERAANYANGDALNLHDIAGTRYGLAICKDMHFASLGRAYGARGAGAMLVPAWDFAYLDAWLEARTTMLRGVENGYAVIRASREGYLTAGDAYGRVIAEASSAALPGGSLIADLPIGAPIATLYTRIGNLVGWLCAAAVFLYFAWLAVRRRRTSRVVLQR